MFPSICARNLTPTSSGPLSPVSAAWAGTADVPQMLHGQPRPPPPEAAVVNVQVRSVASALPARSLTPVAPPLTVAV